MSDQELWEKLKAGQREAWQRIYQQEVAALLRYGFRFTQEKSLVEDCIQDLFVHIWQRREKLGTTTAIRPYLLVALRNRLLKQLAQAQKIAGEEAASFELSTHLNFESETIADEDASEQQAALKKALEQLSPRQREAIFLKYFEGLPYEEICRIMDLNYQSARNLVGAGLKALRQKLPPGLLALIFFLGT